MLNPDHGRCAAVPHLCLGPVRTAIPLDLGGGLLRRLSDRGRSTGRACLGRLCGRRTSRGADHLGIRRARTHARFAGLHLRVRRDVSPMCATSCCCAPNVISATALAAAPWCVLLLRASEPRPWSTGLVVYGGDQQAGPLAGYVHQGYRRGNRGSARARSPTSRSPSCSPTSPRSCSSSFAAPRESGPLDGDAATSGPNPLRRSPNSTSLISASSAAAASGPSASIRTVWPWPAASIISPMMEVPPTVWPSRVTRT